MATFAAGVADDGALEPFRWQRIIRVAGEIARQELGCVDDDSRNSCFYGAKHVLSANDDDVAAQDKIGATCGDTNGVNVVRGIGNTDVAGDGAALFGGGCHMGKNSRLGFAWSRR